MANRSVKLILASRSPRRRELLSAAGFRFEVIPPSETAECGVCGGESPEQLVARLAYQKAADVARRLEQGSVAWPRGFSRNETPPHCNGGALVDEEIDEDIDEQCVFILGCDTVAECRGQILGKPIDAEHARAMLETLSGQTHRVLSGVCLWPIQGGQPMVRTAATTLRMDELSPRRLHAYLAGGRWEGKAGAFGYQDGIDWVRIVEGSPSNVVGLPMELLAEMLRDFA